MKVAGPATGVLDRTDQLETAELETEGTAVWIAGDTAVAVDDGESSCMARATSQVSSSLSFPEDIFPEAKELATVDNFSVNTPSCLPSVY